MIRARITGDDGSKLAESAMAEVRERAPAKITEAVAVLVDWAKRLAGRPDAGRDASTPGSPPLMRTGELVRSIKGRKIRKWSRGYKRRLSWGSNLPQAATLEYGTSRVKARPFLRPAETLGRRDVDRILDEL